MAARRCPRAPRRAGQSGCAPADDLCCCVGRTAVGQQCVRQAALGGHHQVGRAKALLHQDSGSAARRDTSHQQISADLRAGLQGPSALLPIVWLAARASTTASRRWACDRGYVLGYAAALSTRVSMRAAPTLVASRSKQRLAVLIRMRSCTSPSRPTIHPCNHARHGRPVPLAGDVCRMTHAPIAVHETSCRTVVDCGRDSGGSGWGGSCRSSCPHQGASPFERGE